MGVRWRGALPQVQRTRGRELTEPGRLRACQNRTRRPGPATPCRSAPSVHSSPIWPTRLLASRFPIPDSRCTIHATKGTRTVAGSPGQGTTGVVAGMIAWPSKKKTPRRGERSRGRVIHTASGNPDGSFAAHQFSGSCLHAGQVFLDRVGVEIRAGQVLFQSGELFLHGSHGGLHCFGQLD